MYSVGAVRNAEILKGLQPNGHYAGYSIRMYVDDRFKRTPIEDDLLSLGVEIVWKDSKEIESPADSYRGLFWRFEIANDASVDRFAIRDTDSRLNKRDAWALSDWEKSGEPFHCQRDHRHCHRTIILGGLWAAKHGFMPDFWEKMQYYIDNEIEEVRNPRRGDKALWNADQRALAKYVWPVIKDRHRCHDDWRLGRKIGSTRDMKYRVGLPHNMFCGQQFDENDNPIWPGADKRIC